MVLVTYIDLLYFLRAACVLRLKYSIILPNENTMTKELQKRHILKLTFFKKCEQNLIFNKHIVMM